MGALRKHVCVLAATSVENECGIVECIQLSLTFAVWASLGVRFKIEKGLRAIQNGRGFG